MTALAKNVEAFVGTLPPEKQAHFEVLLGVLMQRVKEAEPSNISPEVLARACKDNPDLPEDFVYGCLVGLQEVERGEVYPIELKGN